MAQDEAAPESHEKAEDKSHPNKTADENKNGANVNEARVVWISNSVQSIIAPDLSSDVLFRQLSIWHKQDVINN